MAKAAGMHIVLVHGDNNYFFCGGGATFLLVSLFQVKKGYWLVSFFKIPYINLEWDQPLPGNTPDLESQINTDINVIEKQYLFSLSTKNYLIFSNFIVTGSKLRTKKAKLMRFHVVPDAKHYLLVQCTYTLPTQQMPYIFKPLATVQNLSSHSVEQEPW